MKRTLGREQNHLVQDRVQVTRFSPLVLKISLSVMCVEQISFQIIFHSFKLTDFRQTGSEQRSNGCDCRDGTDTRLSPLRTELSK